MTDELQPSLEPAPLDGAPTWLRIVQAAAIGVVAGFALNAIVSIVVTGDELTRPGTPKTCRKQAPSKDAVKPAEQTPAMGGLSWTLEYDGDSL